MEVEGENGVDVGLRNLQLGVGEPASAPFRAGIGGNDGSSGARLGSLVWTEVKACRLAMGVGCRVNRE